MLAGVVTGVAMVWAIWIVSILLAFAAVEGYAVITRRIPTLSRTVWRLTVRYPIFPFLFGCVCGGLAIHFFGWIPACAP